MIRSKDPVMPGIWMSRSTMSGKISFFWCCSSSLTEVIYPGVCFFFEAPFGFGV